MELFISTYGPYAFGLISLLLIWHHVVAPVLRGMREDRNSDGRANREAIASACQRLENRISENNGLTREALDLLRDTNKLARDTHRVMLEINEQLIDNASAMRELAAAVGHDKQQELKIANG